ncbi:hypothetical protein [Gulosibacter sediminis]|uniref:hypothetical protein n=1 Tax=Gulosibacter sediminis TaxID=1729695 RepID=UPI0024A83454|nr:hypothetical protein [Gulosibacter sediminis]
MNAGTAAGRNRAPTAQPSPTRSCCETSVVGHRADERILDDEVRGRIREDALRRHLAGCERPARKPPPVHKLGCGAARGHPPEIARQQFGKERAAVHRRLVVAHGTNVQASFAPALVVSAA